METPDIEVLTQRLNELTLRVSQLERNEKGIKHYLRVASEYKNADPAQVLAAIQAVLGKAATYEKSVRRRN